MSIQIGNYSFDGPYGSAEQLENQSGVYAILGRNSAAERWNVVDIGESGEMRDRVANHDRGACWRRQGYGDLAVAACYCNQSQRMRIEQELRTSFNPPCGQR